MKGAENPSFSKCYVTVILCFCPSSGEDLSEAESREQGRVWKLQRLTFTCSPVPPRRDRMNSPHRHVEHMTITLKTPLCPPPPQELYLEHSGSPGKREICLSFTSCIDPLGVPGCWNLATCLNWLRPAHLLYLFKKMTTERVLRDRVFGYDSLRY